MSLRSATALAVVWVLTAVLGLGFAQPSLHHATSDGTAPFASANAADYAYDEVTRIPAELQRPARVRPGGRAGPAAQRARPGSC